jgi:cytoplasmic iron level regulating protein YaaA (DUF328/UPF0246 family)
MIAVLSPAKTLDFDTKYKHALHSQPEQAEKASALIKKLKTLSAKKVAALMDLSADLAHLNVERYKLWMPDATEDNSKPAILAFKGDVYVGMEADAFTQKDLAFAQEHLLILSGLYGYLRPMDLIQPYRLEMGTSLAIGRKKNLYQYWGNTVSDYLSAQLAKQAEKTLINLASEEYFKVINKKVFDHKIIQVEFKDMKNGKYQMIGFFAKKARGRMASFIVQHKLEKADDLRAFNHDGYAFNNTLSSDATWVFTRDQPAPLL